MCAYYSFSSINHNHIYGQLVFFYRKYTKKEKQKGHKVERSVWVGGRVSSVTDCSDSRNKMAYIFKEVLKMYKVLYREGKGILALNVLHYLKIS